ncbi:iron-sulfur cluster repair di-iron protein [Ilyomonas limi]|uniref:Iron-sulfur cluster repair di-iron protein n=2 Tax=Ilyomonas limi TaxID=2575867 RepID=A0A4U3L3Y7_9BACT|nr:iron-sulfur cluster repair di-iron protein [Ilyomonas limi]
MKAEKGDIFEWKKIEDGPEVWKVEITKKNDASRLVNPIKESETKAKEAEVFVLNVTLIEPRLKHPTIFKYFDALEEGKAFQLLNDHDPKPLYYQLLGERGNIFTWTYLEKGPQWWRVQIKKNDPQSGETVGEIAAKDLRKAEVFKKYGIDFCCGGKKSLKQACEEKGIDVALVEAELQNPTQQVQSANNYNAWEPDFLADYIYNQHHIYYYNEVPRINDLFAKVVGHHGDHYPELQTLYSLLSQLLQELNVHFLREERVVFPFIKALVAAKRTGNRDALNSQPSLTEPVRMMEVDHEAAGDILAEMSTITNEYNPPADACNSFQFLYKKLKELDEDLRQHIHLENNILFPKALKLEQELRN